MNWTLYQWVWQLESPLFIGMPPASALNRCRLYVPARAIWGAMTAEISRSQSNENMPDYKKFGEQVKQHYRFTYLYPAEYINGKYLPWLPHYEQNNRNSGLFWHLQHDKKNEHLQKGDRAFRQKLLHTRAGTSIDPNMDSAAEGTLRETECMNPWWRNDSESDNTLRPVYLLGYVFMNDSAPEVDHIHTLFLGGDTRYGLGKICRVDWRELSNNQNVFGKPVDLNDQNPVIQSETIWGHAPVNNSSSQNDLRGTQEHIGGWDIAKGSSYAGALAWTPGSCLEESKEQKRWDIDESGFWR